MIAELKHGEYNTYKNRRCRCAPCSAANAARSAQHRERMRQRTVGNILGTHSRRGRRYIPLHCTTCDYTCELPVDMHEHCWLEHGRRLTREERTPRP